MKSFLKEIDKKIYFGSAAIVIVMVLGLIFVPDFVQKAIYALFHIVIDKFGWLYILVSVFCFGLFFYIYFGKYGNIKLGRPEEKPRFSTFSWAAMIFTSGAGSSTVILGFAEPIYYLKTTPFGVEKMSDQAYEYAHMYGQLHWGFSAWAFYIPAVVAICYMLYIRKSKDVKLSNTLTPLLGKRFKHSLFGKLMDIVVVFGIIASITTSLGLAVPVMSKLISNVFGIADATPLRMAVFAIWFFIFGWSVFRGLDKGIKQLTNVNMVIIFGFLLIIALLVPLSKIFEMEINSVGLYISQLPRMIFYTDPFGSQEFVHNWTIFYWGWWLSFLPIMGMFIAKVSRGRTLKQVILGQMVWGSLGCCTFLGLLGGYSLYLQRNGIVDLVSILETEGNAGVVLAIMKTLPCSKILIVLLVILCFVFLATTIDSTSLVLGNATSKELDPDKDPHLYNRFSWAIAIFVLSIGLTAVGGLDLVQKFAIVLGFPLIFMVIFITISTIKAMKEDFGSKSVVATILTGVFACMIALGLPAGVSYGISLVIWLLMAFASGFVFWTALLKAIRIIGSEEEQGTMYGIYYAANGTAAASVAAINLWAYNAGGGDADMQGGFFWAVVSMAIPTLVAAILIGVFLNGKSDKDLSTSEEDKFHFADVFTVLKNPAIWAISIVMFCVYGVYSCTSYFTPYLTDILSFSTTTAGIFSIIRQYIVMLVAAPLGGILADKVFKSTLGWFRCGGAILAISIILVIIGGTLGFPTMLIAILTLIPGLFAMCLYGVMFSSLHELNIPVKVAGTAIGIASIVGYLPDMFLNTIFGNMLDNTPGAGGYMQIFTTLAVFCIIIVVICSVLYAKFVKVKKNK